MAALKNKTESVLEITDDCMLAALKNEKESEDDYILAALESKKESEDDCMLAVLKPVIERKLKLGLENDCTVVAASIP